jgi:hypothetical protein
LLQGVSNSIRIIVRTILIDPPGVTFKRPKKPTGIEGGFVG